MVFQNALGDRRVPLELSIWSISSHLNPLGLHREWLEAGIHGQLSWPEQHCAHSHDNPAFWSSRLSDEIAADQPRAELSWGTWLYCSGHSPRACLGPPPTAGVGTASFCRQVHTTETPVGLAREEAPGLLSGGQQQMFPRRQLTCHCPRWLPKDSGGNGVCSLKRGCLEPLPAPADSSLPLPPSCCSLAGLKDS